MYLTSRRALPLPLSLLPSVILSFILPLFLSLPPYFSPALSFHPFLPLSLPPSLPPSLPSSLPPFLLHCVPKAVRKYLLLGQGDFIRHLMDLLALVHLQNDRFQFVLVFILYIASHMVLLTVACSMHIWCIVHTVSHTRTHAHTHMHTHMYTHIHTHTHTHAHTHSPELSQPAVSLYLHNLTGTLETAIRATNAQFEDPDILKRLDVQKLELSPGDHGWDVFSLQYHVDGPISTV